MFIRITENFKPRRGEVNPYHIMPEGHDWPEKDGKRVVDGRTHRDAESCDGSMFGEKDAKGNDIEVFFQFMFNGRRRTLIVGKAAHLDAEELRFVQKNFGRAIETVGEALESDDERIKSMAFELHSEQKKVGALQSEVGRERSKVKAAQTQNANLRNQKKVAAQERDDAQERVEELEVQLDEIATNPGGVAELLLQEGKDKLAAFASEMEAYKETIDVRMASAELEVQAAAERAKGTEETISLLNEQLATADETKTAAVNSLTAVNEILKQDGKDKAKLALIAELLK